jgi:putative aldouronate transport system permease protein
MLLHKQRRRPVVGSNARQNTIDILRRHRFMYFMMLPGLLYLIVYRYAPMVGLIIAFQRYTVTKTLFNSAWIGLENFYRLFNSPNFAMIMTNTVLISLYKIIFAFPAPIMLALMLNDIVNVKYKRALQTAFYLPHFISWVVLGNIIFVLIAPNSGAISKLYIQLTNRPELDLMMNPKVFRGLLVALDIWKEVGWGSIVYLAAITGIDMSLYEAAWVDGANRRQQLWYITLPGIMMTIMTMLLLRVGRILDSGFEQIFILMNDRVYHVSEILDTFIYKVSFLQGQPAMGAAAGFFKSIIGFMLVLVTNNLAKRFDQEVL